MKGKTHRNKTKSASRRRGNTQRPPIRCPSCGRPVSRRDKLRGWQGGAEQPLCRACARAEAPNAVRVHDAMAQVGQDPRRVRILWRSAHCGPTAFHVLEGGRQGRRGSDPAEPEQDCIGLRESEELLEGESAAQVFIAAGVPEEEAVRVLMGIADHLRHRGYAAAAD